MRHQDRVALSWLDPGMVDGAFATSLLGLAAKRSGRLAETIRIVSGGLLSRSRNQQVSTFLDSSEAAWLLMLDSDHMISLETFDLLIAAADADHPVVAGLYFGAWDVGEAYPAPIPVAHDYVDGTFVPITVTEPRGLRTVDGAGTGCLLIHRSVLQGMRDDAEPGMKDWCWFADGPIGDGRWLSEDLTFCKRLGERGVPIHLHTGAVLPHHKQFWQDDRTYAIWRPRS